MLRTTEQLALLDVSSPGGSGGAHAHVAIRTAWLSDLSFVDHLQKKYSHQLGFLPRAALEAKIERGQVSLALENGEPAAYLLGNGGYQGDAHFGVIYQAAVSYDARRRLLGTALVQHFVDHMEPLTRLVGLWCAQDIEANEFWSACGFEAIAARHGSRRKRRVHIFWVARTQRGRHEPMRYPKQTRGGLLRATRQVYGIERSEAWREIELPEEVEAGGVQGSACRVQGRARSVRDLAEAQRAFRYGGGGGGCGGGGRVTSRAAGHICVVIAGQTRYLPVAPFEAPL